MPGFRNRENSAGGTDNGPNPPRTTFRPPWVKDGPPPLPMPTAPWIAKQCPPNQPVEQQSVSKERPILKKQTKISSPAQSPPLQNSTNVDQPNQIKQTNIAVKDAKPPTSKTKIVKINLEPEIRETKNEVEKVSQRKFSDSSEKMIPPPPPVPPPPPPLPSKKGPPPKPLTAEKSAKLESLRNRPRRRPDWLDMMKEVEHGIKLKHIESNDRSAPIIPKSKAKGQFVYESEKSNAHNELLKEIQGGLRLKKVKTNDRSKPILDGLRKFRRQMTIEEQIQKSASVADVVAMASQPDELDDIDKVRDDLQSTKQMLALELRNKEALERDNKRLMSRLMNLEAELTKEKSLRTADKEVGSIPQVRTLEDDKLIAKLKEEAADSNKVMKEMEDMYKKTAEELDITRAKLESAWLQNAQLESDLKSIQLGIPITKQPSKKLISSTSKNMIPKQQQQQQQQDSSDEESEDEEEEESESESSEEDANDFAAQEKRISREIRLLTSKLYTFREKRTAAVREKIALKEKFKKLSKTLREEQRKYKVLEKEVDKMAKLVKDVDADEDFEEEEEDEEKEEIIEDTETESESESEEEPEDEGDLPPAAPSQEKIANLSRRVKVLETRLNSLKKSNYLLKANIDRRQDELNRQKEMSLQLQEDMNAVLTELG